MRRLFTLVMFFILSVSIFPQHTIRVMTWNIHNYTYYNPPTQFDYDNPALKYVIEMINPDILVCQEVLSQESVDQLLNYVLSPEYKAAVFIDGYDTDNALFYKESKLTSLGNIQLITTLRDINEFRLVHKLTNDTLIVFSLHLKSNVGSGDNQARRYSEATVLRNVTSKLPLNSNYLVAGDFNILNSSELAFNVLINTSSPGYVIDPQQATGNWESNASFAHTHTWSSSNLTVRFDMILFSQALKDKGGIDYVENSY
ncbi:MAG: endonuclease/exonuclease/phosphatase family protein [Melioribacteraceae bacterium]